MAGIVSRDIYRLVKTTTTEIDIMDRIYHGDVDAYNIDIEFYGVTSISGTCNLHFVLPDGTALDKDASDGVVIEGNNVKYTLPTYLYQQSGNLAMYVQFMNSNIYTPLKVNFKNIVAIPDGGEEVVATTTYPVWYDEVVTNEDERIAAELIRVSNEVSRVTAEDARTTWEEFNSSTVYAVGEKVYYPTTGSSYILHTASGVANTLPTDTDYWQIIVEKGASGIIDEFSSTDITGVIAGNGTSIINASADDLPYVNTTSGLAATDAQAAIDEVVTDIGERTYTEQNYVTDGESITASIDALDVSVNSAFDAIDDLAAGGSATPFAAMPYVGTVPIIESSSDDYGKIIKFADGTMIYAGTRTYLGVDISSAYGALYRTSANINFSMPSGFTSIDAGYIGSQNFLAFGAYINDISTSGFTFRPLRATSGMVDIKVSVIVFGRWD